MEALNVNMMLQKFYLLYKRTECLQWYSSSLLVVPVLNVHYIVSKNICFFCIFFDFVSHTDGNVVKTIHV